MVGGKPKRGVKAGARQRTQSLSPAAARDERADLSGSGIASAGSSAAAATCSSCLLASCVQTGVLGTETGIAASPVPARDLRAIALPYTKELRNECLGDEVLVRNDVDTDDRFSRIPIASVVCL